MNIQENILQICAVIALGVLFSSDACAREPIAVIDGKPIYLEDVIKGSEQEIYKAEKALYDLKYAGLRQVMVSRLIAADPKSKGMTENEYLAKFVVSDREFTEKDVDAFIQSRRIPMSKVTATLRQQIKRYLTGEHIAREVEKWMKTQEKTHQISISLKEPEEPRFKAYIDESPMRGGRDAAVTIVEYSDFECPFCTRANDTLHQLSKKYGNKIRLVYKHLPLISLHANAHDLAMASVCAQAQGEDHFWQLHDKIFEGNRGLTLGKVKDFAKEFGLDMGKFNQCLADKRTLARVEAEMREAESFGFNATPGFLINGRILQGAQPIDVFESYIDEELAKK